MSENNVQLLWKRQLGIRCIYIIMDWGDTFQERGETLSLKLLYLLISRNLIFVLGEVPGQIRESNVDSTESIIKLSTNKNM